ncbi:MAG: RyR domain-containing protein [Candidatus Cloacimonetes bacterium]|nr:RyR domain-containing protein [Candidatus Cloacimonadota bacterium]
MYTPKPISTNDINLSPEILALCETLAKNTHDVWAVGRIKEGWSYGATRDDANKKHPCLVPYEELSDSEKEYDRNTAMETLKVIVSLGYEIACKIRN